MKMIEAIKCYINATIYSIKRIIKVIEVINKKLLI